MFLPNLQKNIQELERQISRLETECEHMGRREMTLGPPDSVHQPFITGPSPSIATYSPKMLTPALQEPKCTPCPSRQSVRPPSDLRFNESPKPPEKRSKTSCEESRGREQRRGPDSRGDQRRSESGSPSKRPILAISEASESSDEGQFSQRIMAHLSSKLKEVPREPTWCELLSTYGGKQQHKEKDTAPSGRKASSDEESCESGHVAVCQRPRECQEAVVPRSRRSRSARTRRHHPQEPPELAENTIPSKSLQEKETQCLLWNEEKGKGEFYFNINESVKVLQVLIEELKKRPTQEKRNDVLKNMQDTLKKLSDFRESRFPHKQTHLVDASSKSPEGADNIANMKNALFAVKKICEELTNEKATLAEEMSLKNVAIANLKAKEKEYMTMISNLRYNLEKEKEMAEEGMQAKRDVKILSVKLQEEAKVIEALKTSHEKMQELIENYVLENDRLKAHLKINRLEAQKYSVLLAGKEAEIIKYKGEIESFQKQITEQLCLLRSRATESEIQQTIDAISTHASALQKDDHTGAEEEEDTLESSSMKTQVTLRMKNPSPMATAASIRDWELESKLSTSSVEAPKRVAEKTFSPRRTTVNNVRQFELQNVLTSSNNLRNSINELLEDIKRETSDVYWMSPPNSCGTSRSISNLSMSEYGSDVSRRD